HDRIDAEGGHVKPPADLAEAGSLAEVIEAPDRVAGPPDHAWVLGGSLHVPSFLLTCSLASDRQRSRRAAIADAPRPPSARGRRARRSRHSPRRGPPGQPSATASRD